MFFRRTKRPKVLHTITKLIPDDQDNPLIEVTLQSLLRIVNTERFADVRIQVRGKFLRTVFVEIEMVITPVSRGHFAPWGTQPAEQVWNQTGTLVIGQAPWDLTRKLTSSIDPTATNAQVAVTGAVRHESLRGPAEIYPFTVTIPI